MTFRLSPEALRAGHRLVAFDTIGSTNVEALERARAGETGPLWLVARRQTDGRGRRGSAWQTLDGNLAATLLMTTDLPPAAIAQLGFVAGVALVRALESCPTDPSAAACAASRGGGRREAPDGGGSAAVTSPDAAYLTPLAPGRESPSGLAAQAVGKEPPRRPTFSLKWPNDVVADGAKLAGILLGTEEVATGLRAVAVGFGVNVAAAPEGLPYSTSSLRALGYDAAAEQLFEALSGSCIKAEAAWDRGRDFNLIRALWLARAAGLGQPAAVRTGGGTLQGRFETIDDRGQLVLRDVQGRATFVCAGEVHFGIAASAAMEAVA